MKSISRGLKAASRHVHGYNFYLMGPAGLFKAEDKHPFCWSILKLCNEDIKKCPLKGLTFHKKGSGKRADEIINGGIDLIAEILKRFPNLKGLKFSNT